ncbi:MAG: hypothetical protein QOE77_932 [Blastocatellia bacterium]|jgi:hypothetical protein|nr:hypothetical protein [Blastocatellia bacterium]
MGAATECGPYKAGFVTIRAGKVSYPPEANIGRPNSRIEPNKE